LSLFGDIGDVRKLDGAVRSRLAESLQHIAERAEPHLRVDAEAFARALDQIVARTQHPGVFSRYYDLISAVTGGQFVEANTLLDEIVELANCPTPHFEIVPYTTSCLGADYERFPRLIFAEFSDANPMAPPSEEQAAMAAQNLQEALEIISRVDPQIRREIDALFVKIYLAARNADPNAKGFGGVTSFFAWGASFMNIEHYSSRWDAVQYLVHEVTHGLLFGLSLDEPLVWNAPEESYESPLRQEPRPMDGIYHAALVCGQLANFNKAWGESGLVGKADLDLTRESAAKNARYFQDGRKVIDEHGQLSDLGRRLLDLSEQRLSAVL
jgi:hypothetical protein